MCLLLYQIFSCRNWNICVHQWLISAGACRNAAPLQLSWPELRSGSYGRQLGGTQAPVSTTCCAACAPVSLPNLKKVLKVLKKNFACGGLSLLLKAYFSFAHHSISALFITNKISQKKFRQRRAFFTPIGLFLFRSLFNEYFLSDCNKISQKKFHLRRAF